MKGPAQPMINRLLVCGLGKLGSPIAATFARAGLRVTGYDIDRKKVRDINSNIAPIQEPGLAEAIREVGPLLRATSDPEEAVRGTQACIFVAPTPSLPDGSFDNQYLLEGIHKIAPVVNRQHVGPYFFIIASTVTPGSCDDVLLPAIRCHSNSIELVYKPELIALGTVMHDLVNPDVGLIGAKSSRAAKEVFRLYIRMQVNSTVEYVTMSFVEAELAKISLNCAITMKISFANQVSMVARRLGANPHAVLGFVGQDSRIGKKALRPGLPFGGPCFPRDCRMFQAVANKVSVDAHLAVATDRINADLLADILGSIPMDGDVGILGLAYKAGTTVMEESAGLALKIALVGKGRNVKSHDPLIAPHGLEGALNCRTVVVMLDCAEYRGHQFRPEQFVIDPWGITEKQKELVATR